MKKPDTSISIHKCIFAEQAKKTKQVINYILQKDSLSTGDTKAVRLLTEIYDTLSNPVQENCKLHQVVENNGRCEVKQT